MPHRDEEGKLVLPIETSPGNRRVGQPCERDVVENIVPREAFDLPVESAGDNVVTARVVVEEPCREPNGKSAIPYSVCGRAPISWKHDR